jgi:hypothetical protein
MTLAISHLEKDTAILDCIRETQAPFSPEACVEEFAADLRRYRISTVTGDRYAGEWPREQFQKRGIMYQTSERNRSELYLELLPALMGQSVELLDNQRLISQLCSLERRTARGGRDSVDHAPGGHDDVANAVAGSLVLILQKSHGILGVVDWLKNISEGIYNSLGESISDVKDELFASIATANREHAAKVQQISKTHPDCTHPPTLVGFVGGGQLRCNACALQWWPSGSAPAVNYGGSRGDLLSGSSSAKRFYYPGQRGRK